MNDTVIDTLKFANHLKKAGFEPRQAEGLAHALGDEMAERMVTKRDLDDAVLAINTTLVTMDAKFRIEVRCAGTPLRRHRRQIRRAGTPLRRHRR